MRAISLLLIALALGACRPKPNTATDVSVKGKDAAIAAPITSAIETPREARERKGPLYILRDTGKRCFAAPCPSWAAVDVETRVEKEITGVDLGATDLDGKTAEDVRARVLSGQVWVRGEIRSIPKAGPAGDGTVLFVSAIVEQGGAP